MEPGAGLSLDSLGAGVRVESYVPRYLQYLSYEPVLLPLRMAGSAYLEADGDFDIAFLSV